MFVVPARLCPFTNETVCRPALNRFYGGRRWRERPFPVDSRGGRAVGNHRRVHRGRGGRDVRAARAVATPPEPTAHAGLVRHRDDGQRYGRGRRCRDHGNRSRHRRRRRVQAESRRHRVLGPGQKSRPYTADENHRYVFSRRAVRGCGGGDEEL